MELLISALNAAWTSQQINYRIDFILCSPGNCNVYYCGDIICGNYTYEAAANYVVKHFNISNK